MHAELSLSIFLICKDDSIELRHACDVVLDDIRVLQSKNCLERRLTVKISSMTRGSSLDRNKASDGSTGVAKMVLAIFTTANNCKKMPPNCWHPFPLRDTSSDGRRDKVFPRQLQRGKVTSLSALTHCEVAVKGVAAALIETSACDGAAEESRTGPAGPDPKAGPGGR